jgi:hypothetical protein
LKKKLTTTFQHPLAERQMRYQEAIIFRPRIIARWWKGGGRLSADFTAMIVPDYL